MSVSKKWTVATLLLTYVMLAGIGAITVVVDPYFHYHAPLDGLEYPIYNERYQNDGIVKHFAYDAIITGTSMTENFKASEFDKLFGVTSVKVPFSGGSYKEMNENLERAVKANSEIRYILRCLDFYSLAADKDDMRPEAYPTYLYDEKLLNDVSYVLNKEVLFQATWRVIDYSRSGMETTSFDAYSNWMAYYTFGKGAVAATYAREGKAEASLEATEEDYQIVKENLEQNVISLAEKNPQIQFYFFFPPYSIYYWDSLNQGGGLERQLKLEQRAIELLTDYENIHLFSFFDEFDMICDLDNYKDTTHYGENVNSWMLCQMAEGKHQLTKENYQEYCNKVHEFYAAYHYDALFEDALQ